MAENKTKPTQVSVADFLKKRTRGQQLADCQELVKLFRKVSGKPPRMWGPSIVGFGTWHYTYASGRVGDWPIAAFSPRKRALTVYLTPGFESSAELLRRLGPHSTGKSCLYVKSLADVDLAVLEKLIVASVADVRKLHPRSPAGAAAKSAGGVKSKTGGKRR
jgi:hypothetical protein